MAYINGKKILFASANLRLKDIGENGGVRDNVLLSTILVSSNSIEDNNTYEVEETDSTVKDSNNDSSVDVDK